MSQLTRKAIMKCTLELAEKKSLKKITVKDIADECGLSLIHILTLPTTERV